MDLALNNLQWLICHKNKPNQSLSFLKYLINFDGILIKKKANTPTFSFVYLMAYQPS